MAKKIIFNRGDPKSKVLDHVYLNSIERRLERLENLAGESPILIQNNEAGISIGLDERIDNFEFAKLSEKLKDTPSTDNFATANLMRRDNDGNLFEDTSLPVKEVRSPATRYFPDNTEGMIFRHPKSTKGTWEFIPFQIVKYAKVTTKSSDGPTPEGDSCWYVLARDADDCVGAGVDGSQTPFTVILQERVTYDHDVAVDDVVAYMTDFAGKRVAVSDYTKDEAGTISTEILWGKCTQNWIKATGPIPCDHCTVNPVDNCSGDNPDTGITHTVILKTTEARDPNLETDDIVGYLAEPDGNYVAVSGAWEDCFIGKIVIFGGNEATIPQGWKKDTNFDTNRFVRQAANDGELGGTGGSDTHNHVIHTPHYHTFTGGTPIEVQQGLGTPNIQFVPLSASSIGSGDAPQTVCSSRELESDCSTDEDLDHDSVNHLPPFVNKYFIIRCDNSTTGVC